MFYCERPLPCSFFSSKQRGKVDVMEQTKPKKPKADRGGDWREFWGFFRKVKLSWLWIILSLVISIIYYAAVSMVPGSTAALYSGDFSTAAIMGLVINYACTLVLSLAVSISQLIAQAKSTRSLRNSVWKRMMGIQSRYYDQHTPDRLLSAVTSDAENTVSSLITVIVMVPSLVMYLIMCLAQVSMYSPKLLAVLFVLVPVYLLYGIFMGRWQYKTGRSIQVRIGGLTGFLTERIRNLTLIKTFSTEDKEEKKGVMAAGELYKANVQYQYINGVSVAYTFITEAVGIVAAVIWGSALLRGGEINLEAWLAFFLFVPMINTVLRQFSLMWNNIKEVQGRASRISTMMDAPQEELNERAPRDIPQGDVALRGVDFAYTDHKNVLSGLSLTIPQGKTTAIVGVSGSGKTTILRLLERLYAPTAGTVTVGGQDLNGLNLRAWRDKISYVTQEAGTFSGTVRDCITYGVNRPVSDGELEEVVRQAGIYDYIMEQPGGFDAQLAIWGNAMSGGQRQRLVIARELLKGADILLLDEPTSALDAETAASVCDTIFRRFAGKTIVTVTHELNFIANADQIVVLSGGRVVDSGTHPELMERCVAYRELVEEQSYQEVFAQ